MTGFLLTILGSLGLCLGMKRHFYQLRPGGRFSQRWQLGARIAGALVLCLAAVFCIQEAGVGIGLTLFVAYFNVAIFGLALFLAFRTKPG